MSGIILPGRSDLELPEHAETDLILPDDARRIREAEHAADLIRDHDGDRAKTRDQPIAATQGTEPRSSGSRDGGDLPSVISRAGT